MKRFSSLVVLALTSTIAMAGDYSRVIFSDDFASNAFGPRWGHYKSASVVKDGMLIGITPEKSDHSAVDSIKFDGERDLEVAVKFRYVSEKAKGFNVWFDDKDYKETHAGHICSISITPTGVTVADAKTGTFRNHIYERKKSNSLSADDKAFLLTMTKSYPTKVSLQDWHTLVIQTKGDECSVNIDGKVIGTFKSPGVAHEKKSLVSLTTNQVDVHYDDFSVKGVAK